MKYVLIVLLLTGCDMGIKYPERNDRVIKESKKCTDAGMDYVIGDWGRVFCTKPKDIVK